MLLKITEEIIRRNVFEKLRPVTRTVKALDTEPYDKKVLKMIHSLNRGFAVRNPCVQNMP